MRLWKTFVFPTEVTQMLFYNRFYLQLRSVFILPKTIHIMNPAAGKGILPSVNDLGGEIYVTKRPGDAIDFLRRRLADGDTYHIYAHGGDGTQNEVVNGIMAAGAGKRVTLTPMPTGSGNDFYRVSSVTDTVTPCDLIKYNDKYVLNVLNIGFDCAAAARMRDFKNKPFVNGSAAYILGVATEFIKKTPTEMEIAITDEDGNVEYFNDKFLLCAIANGKFYGGGFKAAPAADFSDGLLDVILVKNISRMRFISLIGDYKNGTHIIEETQKVSPKLADVAIFKRAKKLVIKGAHRYAADGEIIDSESGYLEVEVAPSAISVVSENYKSENVPEALTV